MSDTLALTRDPTGPADEPVGVSRLVRRLVADNPGPMTHTGTCTYVVGQGRVAIIDPGPDLPAHREAILAAVAGEEVAAVLVTHTHRDHSPGAAPLAAALGAPIWGCGPHRLSRPAREGERPPEGSGDTAYRPDREMKDGDVLEGPGWSLRAVATPGHTANHLCFHFPEERALFSGDHVMGWSTTIIAPPDGSMRDYMRSLARVATIEADIYSPGHGGPVRDPQRFVRGLAHHRRQREASILAQIGPKGATIPTIVAGSYPDLAAALRGAAALSVFAHLEDLAERGRVLTDGPPCRDGLYRRA